MKSTLSDAIRILLAGALIVLVLPRAGGAHEGTAQELREVNARIAASPKDAGLVLRRGELHRIRGDFAAARADYARVRRLAPDLAAVDLCLGTMLIEEGRPKEALRALDRFLAREPDHAEAFAARARARLALGDPAGAAADLTRAIDHAGPNDAARPDLYLHRARALASQGSSRLDEALRGLDEGIARLGDPVAIELLAIDLEIRRHRTNAALARLDRIQARSPRKEAWLARRGEILERAGRKDEARVAYAQALAAIRALPPARRATRATAHIEDQVTAALARMHAPNPEREARSR